MCILFTPRCTYSNSINDTCLFFADPMVISVISVTECLLITMKKIQLFFILIGFTSFALLEIDYFSFAGDFYSRRRRHNQLGKSNTKITLFSGYPLPFLIIKPEMTILAAY